MDSRAPASASTTPTPAGPAAAATPSADAPLPVEFALDGRPVRVERDDVTLLEALREDLGVRSVKDGCAPQGQCGCCTVLVDGAPRVACVTPLRRVAGRAVISVDGLDPERRSALVDAFVAHGASQCGFCTPGIICRLAGAKDLDDPNAIENALLAHLCRCTGWRSIVSAASEAGSPGAPPRPRSGPGGGAAARRAEMEGGAVQRIGADIVLGRGGFASDTAPDGCLVAVVDPEGDWALGETLAEARAAAGKRQGRRSGREPTYPIPIPEGDWAVTLQTTWVEPAYLETDASWCEPGGQPYPAAANGGAFGAKRSSPAEKAARLLADRHGRPVLVLLSREDTVRLGPKRPPVAAGLRRDGTGVLRVARPSVESSDPAAAARTATGDRITVEAVAAVGPPVSGDIRAAGWAEGAVLSVVGDLLAHGGLPGPAAGTATATVRGRSGGSSTATVTVDERLWPTAVQITAEAGDPLDEVVLRSYLQGAAHMALGWVCSEAIAVDPEGRPEDLTIRSFGVLRARDTPPLEVLVAPTAGPPVAVADATLAAVAAATWIAQGLPSCWPTLRGVQR